MRGLVLAVAGVAIFSSPALASRANPWDVQFGAPAGASAPASIRIVFPETPALDQGAARTRAVEYGEGYNLRRRIHKVASIATVPLFVTEFAIGQKLYDGSGSGTLRSAHSAVAGGLAALFAVNTVTGGWNLWASRKDPDGRTRKWVHSVLMLLADAGFLATASTAPEFEEEDEGGGIEGNRSLHRNVALVSMGAATVSYLLMLFQ